MSVTDSKLQERVQLLENQLRRMYRLATVAGVVTAALATSAFLHVPQTPDVVRTRQLIIEDGAGRDRVILGAPIRDNFDRVSPATGMVIRDSVGNERFGVSLDARGKVGLGLDAPRCTSQPCNTERINLIADADGGSQVRLMDRHTGVAARLLLDDDDKAYLDFLKVGRDSLRKHRIGLTVDTSVTESRH